jgi:hypothetical protein
MVHRVLTALDVLSSAEATVDTGEALRIKEACTLGAWGEDAAPEPPT